MRKEIYTSSYMVKKTRWIDTGYEEQIRVFSGDLIKEINSSYFYKEVKIHPLTLGDLLFKGVIEPYHMNTRI